MERILPGCKQKHKIAAKIIPLPRQLAESKQSISIHNLAGKLFAGKKKLLTSQKLI